MGELKSPLGPGAVHLCLDMQRLFAGDGPWPTPWMQRVLPAVVTLVQYAPERTLFTRFIPPPSPQDATGQWRAYYEKWDSVTRERIDPSLLDLMPDLQRFVPPARVFDKAVYSAFASGELHPFLRDHNVDTIIVTGAETDVCVLSSVLSAVDLGYRVIVASDGLCSSSDESHDALIALYQKRFDVQIEIAKVEEIVVAWRIW